MMNKKIMLVFVLVILIGSVTAINLGLPARTTGDKVFTICDYNPNDIEYKWTIINQTTNGLYTNNEVQASIFFNNNINSTDLKPCATGYRFNETSLTLSSSSNSINNRINSFIIQEANNKVNSNNDISSNNFGSGGLSITG